MIVIMILYHYRYIDIYISIYIYYILSKCISYKLYGKKRRLTYIIAPFLAVPFCITIKWVQMFIRA